MAKGVGLDAGEYEVKLVELDGSYRKPRLTKVVVESVAAPASGARAADESHELRGAEASLRALGGSGVAKDHIGMSFPCRESVLRLLTVPFVGEERIRKVIKFEAESSIHSHSVDDMIVDFYRLAEERNETKVLVAAVPKPPLRAALQTLERGGIEPIVVDLDTMALFRTAEWCGAFGPDAAPAGDAPASDATEGDAAPAGETLPAPVGELPIAAPPCRLVVDAGARSTRILVVVNGRLVDMRALRIGADSVAEDVASRTGIPFASARQAVAELLRSEEEYYLIEDGAAESDADAELENAADAPRPEAAATSTAPAVRVAQDDVVAGRDRTLGRLRRELVRFSTGVPALSNVEAVWLTGGASRLPGVVEVFADVFGVAPRELDVLGRLTHKLSDEEVVDLNPTLAVAVGLALRQIGGPPGFNFRQEDLAFTKGFDRIKFPLAIACMLALFLVLVVALKLRKELTVLEGQYGSVYKIESIERRGQKRQNAQFLGYVGSLLNQNYWFTRQHFDEKEYGKLVDRVLRTDVFKRLGVIKSVLKDYHGDLQEKEGYFADMRLGSGLGALVELSQLMKSLEPKLGRYLLSDVDLTLEPKDDQRHIVFMVVLRTDEHGSFREKGTALQNALQEAARSPDSAFLGVDEKNTSEKNLFNDGTEGYYLQVRVNLKPEATYPVFPRVAPS